MLRAELRHPECTMRVGYVLERDPSLSEACAVNEILAHVSAGLDVEVFSLRSPKDEGRGAGGARVTAPVAYVAAPATSGPRAAAHLARQIGPAAAIPACRGETAADIYQALVLARLVVERRITHLHAHFADVATRVARMAGHLAGVPYTFTAHARDIYGEMAAGERLARNLRGAAAVIVASDFDAKHLRRTYGRAAARVERVYEGLDPDRFAYVAPESRPPTVIAVGRLIEKNGFADLVDACALLAARRCSFRCVIVGAGPLHGALRTQVTQLGLDHAVGLVGARPQEDVMRLVQRSAVLAAPCAVAADGERDGVPAVLLEALALGTPCVATDVSGIPEIVRNGETGLLVRQHDPSALAAAIQRLLEDAWLRVGLAAAGRRLVERELDVHANAAHVRAVFGRVRQQAAAP
jgi:glycosyltransferase involved in cell wall biosynthesis